MPPLPQIRAGHERLKLSSDAAGLFVFDFGAS
jgi:hypothetical protein